MHHDHLPTRGQFIAFRWLLTVLALLACSGAATAQPPQYPAPRLTSLSPPGARAGTTVEVTFAGIDLDDVQELQASHPGIKAQRLPDASPVRFRLTVGADTPIGTHDLRVVGKWGISNPRAFAVGTLDETQEKEPNSDADQAQEITLNTTVNGVISAQSDVDYYRFAGKKGQRIVVHCAAFEIDSRLNPHVQLFDAKGRERALGRPHRERDAVLDWILPDDGEYLVRVSEYAYLAGGPDYPYRLTVSLAPWIDAVYPPVVSPGKPTSVTLFGRNLPGGKIDPKAILHGRPLERLEVKITPPADAAPGQLAFRSTLSGAAGGLDGFEYRLPSESGPSNPVLLVQGNGPIVLDNEENDEPDKAQEITLPCEVCGRIEKRRDRDWYMFSARAQEVYVIEGFADRLGSPLDLAFTLRRADNRQTLGEFDDNSEIPSVVGRFYTRSDDPKTRFVVPADGQYQLMVRSLAGDVSAGPRHIYRLSIRKEQPDFRLVLIDSDESGGGCAVRRGGSKELQVVCFRHDGFNGEVTLTVEGLPAGITCPPQVVGPTLRQGALVLTAAADAAPWAGTIKIKGTATIDGRQVVHMARAGCVVWPTQQNVPAISRLSRSICLAVRERGLYRIDTQDRELTAAVGTPVEVKLKIDRNAEFRSQVVITRLSAPAQQNGQFVNIPNVTVAPASKEGTIRFTVPTSTPPGMYNLVFRGIGLTQFMRGRQRQNVQVIESSPAIRLTVFRAVADLRPEVSTVTVRPGGETPLVVKVRRLYGFKGALRLRLGLPSGFQGVSASPVTIDAGENEGKLMLRAAGNARPGSSSAVRLVATATFGRSTMTQEVRITVSISKDRTPGASSPGATRLAPLLAESSGGWKYRSANGIKGDRWTRLDFDDKGWRVGKAPLGYGEEEIERRRGTVVGKNFQGEPLLFRRTFDVPADLLGQKGLTVRLKVASDDSATVYLNGKRIDEDPEADHEFSYWNREVDVEAKALRPGRNVIAVLVRNKSGSSDIFLDLAVTAEAPAARSAKGR